MYVAETDVWNVHIIKKSENQQDWANLLGIESLLIGERGREI
jgi:hypothetical protein